MNIHTNMNLCQTSYKYQGPIFISYIQELFPQQQVFLTETMPVNDVVYLYCFILKTLFTLQRSGFVIKKSTLVN